VNIGGKAVHQFSSLGNNGCLFNGLEAIDFALFLIVVTVEAQHDSSILKLSFGKINLSLF
jgi:hypothetical protein